MKRIWLAASIIVFLYFAGSCGQSVEPEKTAAEQQDFYPVLSFIRQELALLDSLPVAITRYRVQEGDTDTSILDKTEFRRIAESVGEPDISRDPLRKGYTETVYMDATINLLTMSYRTKEASATVQKTDVYIDPATEKVKSIYIEKKLSETNSTVLQKIIWSAGRQLQITSVINVEGQPERVIQERFHWGLP
jgi:hypothetical protein